MFTLEQLQRIRQWAISLQVWSGPHGLLEKMSHHDITIENLSSTIGEQGISVDAGLSHVLFIAALENLIPAAFKNQISATAATPTIEKESFLAFIRLIAAELMKKTQAINALYEVMRNENSLEAHTIRSWLEAQKNLLWSLLLLCQLYQEPSSEMIMLKALTSYEVALKAYNQQLEVLQSMDEGAVKKVGSHVIRASQNTTQKIFQVLGLRKTESTAEAANTISQPVRQSRRRVVASSTPSSAAAQSSTQINPEPASSPQLNPTAVSSMPAITTRPILQQSLERSFDAARFQQYALSGHNFLLACRRPTAYVAQASAYAEHMSAVLMAQQMVLSDRYVEQASRETIETLKATEGLSSEHHQNVGNFAQVCQKALEELINSDQRLSDGSAINPEQFIQQLTQKVSGQLVQVAPDFAQMLVGLSKRADDSILRELGSRLSNELPSVLTQLPSRLQDIIQRGQLLQPIQQGLQNLFSTHALQNLDRNLSQHLGIAGALLSGEGEAIADIFKNCELLQEISQVAGTALSIANLAQSVFGGGNSSDINGLFNVLGQGLSGGTFMDVGGGAIGAAVNQFLPVVTSSIFGNDDFGHAAGGAISGALSGLSVGGPIGALVGAGVGLISSLFGGNAEEEARARQAEMQRMMQDVSKDIKAYTGACFEQMDQRMMRRFADVQIQLSEMAKDIHDHIGVLGIQLDRVGAAILEGMDQVKEAMQHNAAQVHQHLNALAKYNEYRFDRLESTIYKVGEFLYEGLKDMQSLINARFDHLEAITQRAITMLDRRQEQRFAEQRQLLLRLREEQRNEHRETIDRLDVIDQHLDILGRVLNSHIREVRQAHQMMEEVATDNTLQRFAKLKAKAMNNPKASKVKDLLNSLSTMGSDSSFSGRWPEYNRMVFWTEVTLVYLHLFYQFSDHVLGNPKQDLKDLQALQKFTKTLLGAGLKFQQSFCRLPEQISAELIEYQNLIYSVYHDFTEGYLDHLEGKEQRAPQHDTLATALAPWREMQQDRNYVPERNYHFEKLVAKLNNNRLRSQCQILDVLDHGTKGIWFYAIENNRFVTRHFDINRALTEATEAGQNPDHLLAYPLVLADYREVSLLADAAQAKEHNTYRQFIAKWEDCKGKAGFLPCSTPQFAIRYCDRASGKTLYLWHPKKGCLEIKLPQTLTHVTRINCVVRWDELIVAAACVSDSIPNQETVWLGSWNIATANPTSKAPFESRITIASGATPNEISLLREWSGYLVLNNAVLLNPETLGIQSDQADGAKAHYDQDPTRIRLFRNSSTELPAEPIGAYFDYAQQRFVPVTQPRSETSERDQGPWVFYDNYLYLHVPTRIPFIQSSRLTNQRLIGRVTPYDVYVEPEGEVLLLRSLTPVQKSLADLHHEVELGAWQRYQTMKKNWLKVLRGESLTQMNDYEAMTRLREFSENKLKVLTTHLELLLEGEISKNPELKLHITNVKNGVQNFAASLAEGHEDNVMKLTLEFMRSTFILHQHVFSMMQSANTLLQQSVIGQTLVALNRLAVWQNIAPVQVRVQPIQHHPLVPLYGQAVGLGIWVGITQKNDATQTSFALHIKVFGQSWSEFCANDLLFMERFREQGQHRRVLELLLDGIENYLKTQKRWDTTKPSLKEQFFAHPDQPLVLACCPFGQATHLTQFFKRTRQMTLEEVEEARVSAKITVDVARQPDDAIQGCMLGIQ